MDYEELILQYIRESQPVGAKEIITTFRLLNQNLSQVDRIPDLLRKFCEAGKIEKTRYLYMIAGSDVEMPYYKSLTYYDDLLEECFLKHPVMTFTAILHHMRILDGRKNRFGDYKLSEKDAKTALFRALGNGDIIVNKEGFYTRSTNANS